MKELISKRFQVTPSCIKYIYLFWISNCVLLLIILSTVGYYGYHSLFRVSAGFILGVVFILSTKKILDQYEDLKFGAIEGAGAQKILLIVFVMTLHSLTEGIGIGVSFGKYK